MLRPAAGAALPGATAPAAYAGADDPGDGTPLRVLMVEDVETDAELILAALRRSQLAFTARRCETAAEFVRLLAEFDPHIILADYSLPQFSALDAMALLRERRLRLPFILVTGTQTEEIAVQCIQEGADDYILKERLGRLPAAVSKAIQNHCNALEKERTELQLIQAEKMESVGRLAAGVAHEVKNPLTVILMGVEYLRQRFEGAEPEVVTLLHDMEASTRKANTVIRGLLDFSMPGMLDRTPTALNGIVESALALARHEFARACTEVVLDLSADLPRLELDRNKIEQVFVNLFLNAVQSMPDGGRLTVRTASRHGGVHAEVEDTGTGIPPDKLGKIFEPFYTTKLTGHGSGLGLTVVKKILDLHGATIAVRNKNAGGVLVSLVFHLGAVQ